MNLMNHARLSTQSDDDVVLEGVKASGDLRGALLEMSVEQRFRNPSVKNVEIVYSFPLPWGAVLLDVSVQLGERHLTGAVVEKKQAEARYEETLSEGNAAIMLEKNNDGSHSLNLGNLAANESCVITLRYAQTLQFEQRGLRLLIPTVIAPRYGDPVQDGGLQPHQALEHCLMAEYPFDIELRLHGDLGKARIASPSHPIALRVMDEGGVTVSLARRGALDRDFVLVIDELAHESAVVLARDSVESGYVTLASFCPRIAQHGPAALALKLLVDCSGSMAGDSIDAAKRALQAIVLQMNKGDRFSLSRFGGSVEHRCRALWKATDATMVAAQCWIGDLQADLGGTEMEAALKSTFARTSGVPCDVLMVTDGEINAIDQTIEAARNSGHRVFVVGIGSSPAESHVRRLAEATGGACDFVAPGEAVEPAVLRMFARLRSGQFEHVSIVWQGKARPKWSTAIAHPVFDGDTVNVYALFRQAPTGTAQLIGTRPGNDTPEVLASAEFGSALEPAAALSRMAAHARVAACWQRGGFKFAKEALRLSVAYQLVTDQTNYLLVHQRAEGEQAANMPDLHKVAQMVPAGWGGVGLVDVVREILERNAPRGARVLRMRLGPVDEPLAPSVDDRNDETVNLSHEDHAVKDGGHEPEDAQPREIVRSCGQLTGSLDKFLPCLYFGQLGIQESDLCELEKQAVPGLFAVSEHERRNPYGITLIGLILPLRLCRDEKARVTLQEIAVLINDSQTSISDKRRAVKAKLNEAFDGNVEIADKEPLDGFFAFESTLGLFRRLLRSCDYVTRVLDKPESAVRAVEAARFDWYNHGELADWYYHICSGLIRERRAITPFFISNSEALLRLCCADHRGYRGLSRPATDLAKCFVIRPGLPDAQIGIRLEMEPGGWGKLHLTLDSETATIRLSEAYDPFYQLVSWGREISEGDLPIEMEIEEEGPEAVLTVLGTENPKRVLLRVIRKYEEEVLLEGIVARAALAAALKAELLRFFTTEFDPQNWNHHQHPNPDDPVEVRDMVLNNPWIASAK